jgi:hypothetical protein
MRQSIVHKLAQHLSVPVDTEPNAVYLLCELRKLFHHRNPLPLSIDMCANWALHVKLDRNPGVRKFLKDVDDFVGEVLDQGDVPLPAPIFKELSFVGSFRQDLRECLSSEGLPTSLCDEDPLWFAFVQAYAGVIEDGELACDGGGFRNIQRLVFKKGRTLTDADLPFTIDWDITLSSGELLKATFHTFPEAGGGLVWGLTLPPGFVHASLRPAL